MYYLNNGKPEKGVRLLRESSDQGCLPSLLFLGLSTKEGRGTPKNVKEGVQMIEKAAIDGSMLAQITLSVFLINGNGVSKDEIAAFNWMKRAADTGDSGAIIIFTDFYNSGTGTQKKQKEGLKLLKKVYESKGERSSFAAYAIGAMYMDGSLDVDIIKAFRWTLIGKNAGIPEAEENYKSLLKKLPKQKLVSSCGMYLHPPLATNNTEEYVRVNSGEIITLLSSLKQNHHEVHFPDRNITGYVPWKCLEPK